jgi:restriction system protein
MMDNLKVPQHFRYIIPIVDALKKLGGSGRASEVIDLVVEKLGVSGQDLLEINKRVQPKIQKQIYWAKFFLAKTGYLSSPKYGVWNLTEKGLKFDFSSENLIDLHMKNKEWWYSWFNASAENRDK